MIGSGASSAAGAASTAAQQLVGFNLDGGAYALPIEGLREILRYADPSPLPNTRPYVAGVLSLRGTIVAIVDLRRRFGAPDQAPDGQTRIVLCEMRGETVGLTVDAVSEIFSVPAGGGAEQGGALGLLRHPAITRVVTVGEQLVIVLEPDALLSDDENESLAEATARARQAERAA